jgi:hypothetical protein
MGEAMPIDADQIVRAATVIGRKDSVFCLGPFPKRVSFTAQQNRALNLVWALRKLRRFNRGERIAIVGAGVAGVTAAAGFAAHGCIVEVFESEGVAMSRQKQTNHRMAHPTINRWPMAPLESTTCLPFMEWYADSCSEIIKTLTEQFDTFAEQATLRERHTVLDVTEVATNLVRLTTMPAQKEPTTYSLVVIAIGFGEEKDAEGFKPVDYWKPDGLESLRDQNMPPTFIVSGCGDGGLIDALRIAHKQFDRGDLAFEVAALLTDTPLARKIAKVESAARLNKSATDLPKIYSEAFDLLDKAVDEKSRDTAYGKAVRLLDSSLSTTRPFYLVDNFLAEPYSLNAAPIHKLMIAHAIGRGAVRFTKTAVERAGDKIKAAGRTFDQEPQSKVIIRHGAKFEFKRLLTESECEELRKKQEELSDDHAEPVWKNDFPGTTHWPKRSAAKNGDFIKSRRKLAIRAVRRISVDATLKETASGFSIQYADDPPAQGPKRLFGVEVQTTSLQTKTGLK